MKYIKPYWQIIFPILIMLLIWSFSAQNGESSDGISIPLALKLGLTNGVVRKIAHFIIYALLGASLANFFRSIEGKKFPKLKAIILSVLIAVIYSCIDEYHQSFIPDRDGNPVDILIDSLGATAGISAYIAAYSLYRVKRAKKQRKRH
jgi:VanZ family protein